MSFQKIQNRLLILLRCKGTGRIYQSPSRAYHPGGLIQNLPLTGCAHLHMIRAPLAAGLFILTEHPFPGAGGIHHNPVKKFGEILCQPARLFVGHHTVFHSHPFHILRKDPGSGRVDLIREKKALSLEPGGNMAGLSSGRRTQIQHPLSWPGIQEFYYRHGAGLLDIV